MFPSASSSPRSDVSIRSSLLGGGGGGDGDGDGGTTRNRDNNNNNNIETTKKRKRNFFINNIGRRKNNNNNNNNHGGDEYSQFLLTQQDSNNKNKNIKASTKLDYCCCCYNIFNYHHNEELTKIAISVTIYWTFVSLIPIYNKYFFQKTLYPYPIATAGIQLFAVATILAIWNITQHYYYYYYYDKHCSCVSSFFNNNKTRQERDFSSSIPHVTTTDNGDDDDNDDNVENYNGSFQPHHQDKERDEQQQQQQQIDVHPEDPVVVIKKKNSNKSSWIFDHRHIWWKLKWCTPIGILFGLKYGVTNWGLHLVPAPTHLLLQSTDLVWTVLGAWYINCEIVKPIEMICLIGCIIGSFVLSWNQLQQHNNNDNGGSSGGGLVDSSMFEAPLFAVIINLLSPMLLGLCIATLRLACTELMNPNNRVGGSVTSVELTSMKLFISSVVAILLATIFERGSGSGGVGVGVDDGGSSSRYYSWWYSFFYDIPDSTRFGVIGGAILIAIFQVNCTFLTYLTNAVSVGLVGQVKIIPQWVTAAIFAHATANYKLQSMNIIGAILIMMSAATFCLSNYYYHQHQHHRDSSSSSLLSTEEEASTTYSTSPTTTPPPPPPPPAAAAAAVDDEIELLSSGCTCSSSPPTPNYGFSSNGEPSSSDEVDNTTVSRKILTGNDQAVPLLNHDSDETEEEKFRFNYNTI